MGESFVIDLQYPGQKALTHYTAPAHFLQRPRDRQPASLPPRSLPDLYRPPEFPRRGEFHLTSALIGEGVPPPRPRSVIRDSRRRGRRDQYSLERLLFVYPDSSHLLNEVLAGQIAVLRDRCGEGGLLWELSRVEGASPSAAASGALPGSSTLESRLLIALSAARTEELHSRLSSEELELRRKTSLRGLCREERQAMNLAARRESFIQTTSALRHRLLSMQGFVWVRREKSDMAIEEQLSREYDRFMASARLREQREHVTNEMMKKLSALRSESDTRQRADASSKAHSDARQNALRASAEELRIRMESWMYLHQTLNEAAEGDRDFYRHQLLTVNYHLREIGSRRSEGVRSLSELLKAESSAQIDVNECEKELKILEITIHFLNGREGSSERTELRESEEEHRTLSRLLQSHRARHAELRRSRRECERGLQRLCALHRQKLQEKQQTLDRISRLLLYKVDLIRSVYPFSLLFDRTRLGTVASEARSSQPTRQQSVLQDRSLSSRQADSPPPLVPPLRIPSVVRSQNVSRRFSINPMLMQLEPQRSSLNPRALKRGTVRRSCLRMVSSIEFDLNMQSTGSPRAITPDLLESDSDDVGISVLGLGEGGIEPEEIVEEENLVLYREIYEDIVSLQELLQEDYCAFPDPASLAEIIRKKPFYIRTDLERQWVALDYRIHRDQYSGASEEERRLIETHPSYSFRVSESRLQELSTLGGILSEAVGEVESEQEWHIYLVNQEVSLGRNDQSREYEDRTSSIESREFDELFARQQRQLEDIRGRKTIDEDRVLFSVLDGILHPELYQKPYTSERFQFSREELEGWLHGDSSSLSGASLEAWQLYNRYNPTYVRCGIDSEVRKGSLLMSNVDELKTVLLLNKTVFSVRCPSVLLDRPTYERLYAAESVEHSLELPLDTLYGSLTVSISYRGETRGQYFPGRLSARLCYLGDGRQVSLGYSRVSDIRLSSSESEGEICIQHRPRQVPLLPGRYRLLLRSHSRVYYRVRVEAEVIDPLDATLHRIEREVREVASRLERQQREHQQYACVRSLLREKRLVLSSRLHDLDRQLTAQSVQAPEDVMAGRCAPYESGLLEIDRLYGQRDRLSALYQAVSEKVSELAKDCAPVSDRYSFFLRTLPHCYEILKRPVPETLVSAPGRAVLEAKDFEALLCPLSPQDAALCPLADESDPSFTANCEVLRGRLRQQLEEAREPPEGAAQRLSSSSSLLCRMPSRLIPSKAQAAPTKPYCDVESVASTLRGVSPEEEPCRHAYLSEQLEIASLDGPQRISEPVAAYSNRLRRRDRLLGRQAAYESVSLALEEMYIGWSFGEVPTGSLPPASSSPSLLPPHPPSPSRTASTSAASSWADDSERTLRFGLFSVTMQFFRSLHFLRKMRVAMASNAPIASAFRSRFDGPLEEMGEEKEAHQTRSSQGAKAESPPQPVFSAAARRWGVVGPKPLVPLREKYRKQRAATTIQRIVRGWLTRVLFREFEKERSLSLLTEPLRSAASLAIQRVWRGFRSRKRYIVTRISYMPISLMMSSIGSEPLEAPPVKRVVLPRVFRRKGLFSKEEIPKPNWLDCADVDIAPEVAQRLFDFALPREGTAESSVDRKPLCVGMT